MKKKTAHKELKQKVSKLKKTAVSYNQTKKNLKASLKKQGGTADIQSEPEMALEVLDKRETEEQPVEQALIAEHIFRKTIEESIPCGISGFDMEGNQIYVNRVFCEMVGWPEEELIGAKYPFKYWRQEDIEIFSDNFQVLLGADVPSDGIELPFRRKNGDRFWGLVLSSILTDSKGNKRGQLMSVADISVQKRAEKSLRALSSQLINAQESERKIVSQDLHDSIGGKLTGIKYSLEKIISDLQNVSDSLEKSLKDVLSIVQRTIEEAQRITKNLHPSILDDLGLFAAIREMCREFREVYSDLQIKNNFEMDENGIPQSLKILIFRIIQEAFNNIVKHSGADTVELSLTKSKRLITLTIQDNGKGFDLQKVLQENRHGRGLGLQTIRERTELFNGSIDIKSKREKGTTIRAIWPLQVNLKSKFQNLPPI
jgi:PAS domain S-box-containing protein